MPLESLTLAGPKSRGWVLENVLANRGSLRISSQSALGTLPIACPARVPIDSTIEFGRSGADGDDSCMGAKFLKSGWGAPEALGVWSSGGQARLSLATAQVPKLGVEIAFDLSTYTGLGFYSGMQSVKVVVNDRELAKWNFKSGSPAPDARIVIPPELVDSSGSLDITFEIDPPLNPHKLGISADDRDLGVSLRSARIESIKSDH
jgi:hypothetical protein